MSSAFDRLPLNALRVFEAVATQLSFAAAADALNVTPAAVSMQIKSLEDYLQTPLFRRAARSIELTPEGVRFLPSVRAALEELRRGVQRLRADRSGGPLQVSMLASFLQRWFVQRVPAFTKLHPDIDLRIHTSIEAIDFATTDMHAAIRYGRGNWAGLHADKLLDDWLVPVAAPALVKRLGFVDTEKALARYTLLHSDSEPWTLWTEAQSASKNAARKGATTEVALPEAAARNEIVRGIALDDSVAVLSAAEHGQGIALARWSLIAAEIEQGRLAAASKRSIPFAFSYYFVCPPDYLMLTKVAQLRDWLLGEAQKFPTPG